MEAFDMFYKCHKIFNQDYEPNIYNAMNFLQCFIYNLRDGTKRTTVHMKEVFVNLTKDPR